MTPTPALIAVHTTVGSEDDARRIGRALVEMKLVACAQIEAIESFYYWDGVLQREPEWRIVLKTTADRYPAVETALRERHPYELPAIYSLAVDAALGPYVHWVAAQCTGKPKGD